MRSLGTFGSGLLNTVELQEEKRAGNMSSCPQHISKPQGLPCGLLRDRQDQGLAAKSPDAISDTASGNCLVVPEES